MSSSDSSSNTRSSPCSICVATTIGSSVFALILYALLRATRPVKLPEFSISGFAVSNLDSNSSSAISVDIQVESHCDSYIMYHTMSVYVLKNGRMISEVSMPAFGQEMGESLGLKARMVVPNGGGVGFNYWSQAGGRVLNFDIRVSANVDLDYIKELEVTCEGIGVGFGNARNGSMVEHVKHCLVHEEDAPPKAGRQTPD